MLRRGVARLDSFQLVGDGGGGAGGGDDEDDGASFDVDLVDGSDDGGDDHLAWARLPSVFRFPRLFIDL